MIKYYRNTFPEVLFFCPWHVYFTFVMLDVCNSVDGIFDSLQWFGSLSVRLCFLSESLNLRARRDSFIIRLIDGRKNNNNTHAASVLLLVRNHEGFHQKWMFLSDIAMCLLYWFCVSSDSCQELWCKCVCVTEHQGELAAAACTRSERLHHGI